MACRIEGQSDGWMTGKTRVAGGVRPIGQPIERRGTMPPRPLFSDWPGGARLRRPNDREAGFFCYEPRER